LVVPPRAKVVPPSFLCAGYGPANP